MSSSSVPPDNSQTLVRGEFTAVIRALGKESLHTYDLSSNQPLRDDNPLDGRVVFSEKANQAQIRSGDLLFDGLYAMAISEALQNSVSEVSDSAYNGNVPMSIEAYQTGEKWPYVWTRDLAYALYLGLAGFDPQRAVNSLLFKSSRLKDSVTGGEPRQILQDMGSGGSYPVSTDRVVWALGAHETLKYLSGEKRAEFLDTIYPVLCGTIEQDRVLAFDGKDGLYRGEHSFLDWREQTYPARTKENVLPIAMSKALSVNAANYFLLKTASEYSLIRNEADLHSKYRVWADELKEAINGSFFDEQRGLYRTYLFSDEGRVYLPSARYDLLGICLTILVGIADPARAKRVLQNYPAGVFGPPVVVPQESSVDIYHNLGIWPFVTAFWLKAARQVGNAGILELGIQSLHDQAALNLSNMENFDFLTGQPYADDGVRMGPVINSRRQLWSVAGYLSMVQDIVFGLETSVEGIRFRPAITGKFRNDTLRSSSAIELRNFAFRETNNRVKVHLPSHPVTSRGICGIDRVELNGNSITDDFVPAERLSENNVWEIFLNAPSAGEKELAVSLIDVSNPRSVFAPVQPEWVGTGVENGDGRTVLRYRHPESGDESTVRFNMYRDGQICAKGITETEWVDTTHEAGSLYHVEAYYPESGNVSHPAPGTSRRTGIQEKIIPAADMHNQGASAFKGTHFEKWGDPVEVLTTQLFQVDLSGSYFIRVEFANGSGAIPTGITCAIKRLEVLETNGGQLAWGYPVMPQSHDWNRWDLSSGIPVVLEKGRDYQLRLSEDEYCRNMSSFQNNERYTAHAGGGADGYNRIHVTAFRLSLSLPESGLFNSLSLWSFVCKGLCDMLLRINTCLSWA